MAEARDKPGHDIYRRLSAIRPADLSEKAWAERAEVSGSFFQDLKKKGVTPSYDRLERVLGVIGYSVAAFEAMREEPPTRAELAVLGEHPMPFRGSNRSPVPLPVYGTAIGADLELQDGQELREVETTIYEQTEAFKYVSRPAALSNQPDAYVLITAGESMAPRFRNGETVVVVPRQPPQVGDDVIVQIRGGGDEVITALIKTLRRRTAAYVELEQYNPAIVFRVPADRVASIHRIVPLGELLGY